MLYKRGNSGEITINNAPATILVFWGGISPADVTHLQVFDIPLISNIPNVVYLAPTNKEEYLAMLDWSVEQTKYPVAIRVPMTQLISTGEIDKTNYDELNKFKIANNGEKVAIIAVGNFYQLGEQVQKKLKEEKNINATLINPVYLTGLDEKTLEELKNNHDLVITLENKILEGSSESCELEACKQAQIVLCVLSSACRLSLQISPKIQGFQSAECLEDFPLSEHQNIRKAVLCVLPKEFCVRRSGKDPKIQGLHEGAAVDGCHPPPPYRLKMLLCSIALMPFKAVFGIEGIHEEHE